MGVCTMAALCDLETNETPSHAAFKDQMARIETPRHGKGKILTIVCARERHISLKTVEFFPSSLYNNFNRTDKVTDNGNVEPSL